MNLLAENAINIVPSDQFADLNSITLSSLISGLITLVLVVAAIIFFFMLIVGGLRWILSGGDKASTEAARNQITAALIGLVIVFGAFAIAQVVQSLFGISIFNLTLPSFVPGADSGGGGLS